jgi:hypothetical protein
MPHPLVVNSKKETYDIYIGRGNFANPLGNRYSHLANSKEEFLVKSREMAIDSELGGSGRRGC